MLLRHHLKALELPTILAECQKIATRCAKDNVDHLGFLLQLCELELIDREKRAAERQIRPAVILRLTRFSAVGRKGNSNLSQNHLSVVLYTCENPPDTDNSWTVRRASRLDAFFGIERTLRLAKVYPGGPRRRQWRNHLTTS